ncbi:MAG: phosphoribosylformylglycinamidine synthase subunit PurS [Coriobacteriales bacterium]|jgi:phosphoribosylformylglycinamidine synthase|nr:phosphoribosylformylglycinamidine synthase subunit PurS [Coriobacteriales bacterium]
MKRYQIHITGKQGIFDPAGAASKNALLTLGYEGLEDLRIGKFIELSCADDVSPAQVEEMCAKLLANPVIEDFRIEEIVGNTEVA